MQDHDRAYVVGETTFGKALVQSIYRISGGAGLALTTAHYYTPSGRLIQRPWDATFDEYQLYTLMDQNVAPPHNPKDLKYTDGGRPVYGGGGIQPDKRIAGPVGPGTTYGWSVGRFARQLTNRQEFAVFAQDFSADGDHRVGQASSGRHVVKENFVVDDQMLAEFRQQLVDDHITIDEDQFTHDLEYIKAMMRFEIDSALFGVGDAWRHMLMVDPQAQVALGQFGEAQKLLDLKKPASRPPANSHQARLETSQIGVGQ
jgi:carboxyl-terminal processing protease